MSEEEKEPLMITPGGGGFPFAVVGEMEQALSKVTSDEHCKGLGEELHKLAEQAEQEPVAWIHPEHRKAIHIDDLANQPEWVQTDWKNGTPLYAAPVRTKDLTDDEIYDVCKDIPFVVIGPDYDLAIARAVIAKFKEKNK